MMFNSVILGSLALQSCSVLLALAAPTGDTSLAIFSRSSTDIVLSSSKTIMLSGVHNDAADAANPVIVTAAIVGAGTITNAVCNGKNGTPGACLSVALVSLAGVFLSVFLKRDADSVAAGNWLIEGVVDPLQLAQNTPESDDFIHIGNVTYAGVFHTIHYAHNNGIATLRSIQQGGKLARRQDDVDQWDQGGLVADYSFSDLNQPIFNEFANSQSWAQTFGNGVSDEMVNENTLLACANFDDSRTKGIEGLVSVGWNDQPVCIPHYQKSLHKPRVWVSKLSLGHPYIIYPYFYYPRYCY
jgi:hypothetical protein